MHILHIPSFYSCLSVAGGPSYPPPPYRSCDCCPLIPAEVPFSETPSSYGYDPEESAPGGDPLSYGASPPPSPRRRSKSRSSRDTQSSGSLESTLSVRTLPSFHLHQNLN